MLRHLPSRPRARGLFAGMLVATLVTACGIKGPLLPPPAKSGAPATTVPIPPAPTTPTLPSGTSPDADRTPRKP